MGEPVVNVALSRARSGCILIRVTCHDRIVLCAAVDIGSNTTRVLVAEPQEGQLRKVMEQRAYTRFDKDSKRKGRITDEKIAEIAEVVTTQVRLAEELGAEAIRIVATAAVRESKNASEATAKNSAGSPAP